MTFQVIVQTFIAANKIEIRADMLSTNTDAQFVTTFVDKELEQKFRDYHKDVVERVSGLRIIKARENLSLGGSERITKSKRPVVLASLILVLLFAMPAMAQTPSYTMDSGNDMAAAFHACDSARTLEENVNRGNADRTIDQVLLLESRCHHLQGFIEGIAIATNNWSSLLPKGISLPDGVTNGQLMPSFAVTWTITRRPSIRLRRSS